MTPLPPVDPEAVAAFWNRALRAGADLPGTPPPPAEYFGDHAEMADELIGLVLQGRKRATAGAMADHDHGGEPIPMPGDRWIGLDGAGRPRALLRVTSVRFGPLSSVDDDFAQDEGEGDGSRGGWLKDHADFFARRLPSLGLAFHPEIEVVFQRFAVDYRE